MIVALDIGNFAVKCASLADGRVIDARGAGSDDAVAVVRALCPDPDAIVVSSVQPDTFGRIEAGLKRIARVLVAGRDLGIPIRNTTRQPDRVGSDRLLAALAAHRRFGGPLVVVDFGTAITVDAVSADGEFLGGAIAPGVRTALGGLSDAAALLPTPELRAPESVIGRDTEEAMLAGVVIGTARMVEGLARDVARELGGSPRVVATGGDVQRFRERLAPDVVEPHLVLLGLWDAYESAEPPTDDAP